MYVQCGKVVLFDHILSDRMWRFDDSRTCTQKSFLLLERIAIQFSIEPSYVNKYAEMYYFSSLAQQKSPWLLSVTTNINQENWIDTNPYYGSSTNAVITPIWIQRRRPQRRRQRCRQRRCSHVSRKNKCLTIIPCRSCPLSLSFFLSLSLSLTHTHTHSLSFSRTLLSQALCLDLFLSRS